MYKSLFNEKLEENLASQLCFQKENNTIRFNKNLPNVLRHLRVRAKRAYCDGVERWQLTVDLFFKLSASAKPDLLGKSNPYLLR